MEDLQKHIQNAKDHMDKSIHHFTHTLAKVRAGRAMPNMLDGIMIDYYGTPTPVSQVASVTTPDARTLSIKPWEKKIIHDIERAIINSDLGLNPQSDGETVRLNIPVLTEERRRDLVKQVKNEAEHARVSIRNIRKDANEHIKKLVKESVSEDEVKKAELRIQELTDGSIKKIDELAAGKEKEIMTV
jgi:ribosome recycling factor